MPTLLRSLRLTNFGCHRLLELTDLSSLVVLVGENDAGKSLVLAAVEALFDPRSRYEPARCWRDAGGTPEGSYTIEARLQLPNAFGAPPSWNVEDQAVQIRRQFSEAANLLEAWCRHPADERVATFNKLKASEQKDLLEEFDVVPGPNAQVRIAQLDELLAAEAIQMTNAWTRIRLDDLPSSASVELISSSGAVSAEAVVRGALVKVVREVIGSTDDDGNWQERAELTQVREEITARLNDELESLYAVLRGEHHARVQAVEGRPIVDFARALTSIELELDLGHGLQPLSGYGEGTNRRAWMAALDWQSQRGLRPSASIRLFDEPDTALHFRAQQRLLRSILAATGGNDAVQSFVATHSLALLDRVPPSAVRLLRIRNDGSRDIVSLTAADGDQEAIREVAKAVGLTNSALLYERAFLLVEGESEAEALPTLYRRLYERSMDQDGIVLVNLFSCGAWKPVVQLLLRSRIELVRMLLDQDCTDPDSSAKLTVERLMAAGCPANFVEHHVTFIGQKEYEDAFDDQDILLALNAAFPREDGMPWTAADLQPAREGEKFSEVLKMDVRFNCKRGVRNDAKKPEIARAIAEHMQLNRIPAEVLSTFTALREIAGQA